MIHLTLITPNNIQNTTHTIVYESNIRKEEKLALGVLSLPSYPTLHIPVLPKSGLFLLKASISAYLAKSLDKRITKWRFVLETTLSGFQNETSLGGFLIKQV